MGGIEGLPLQLMIVILVATMGVAIIAGWMGSIETPHSIGTVEFDNVTAENDRIPLFEVTVYDQDGELLPGATVLLDGLNVRMNGGTAYAVTDEDGKATFENLKISPAGSSRVGYLYISVEKPGYASGADNRAMVIL